RSKGDLPLASLQRGKGSLIRFWSAVVAALLLLLSGCAGAPPREPPYRGAPPAPRPGVAAPPGVVVAPPFEAAGPRFIRVLLSERTPEVVLGGEAIPAV